MATVWFEGIEDLYRLERDLAGAPGRVTAEGSALVRHTALAMEATMKVACPVDTGATRESIGTDITGDGRHGEMTAVIGPTTSYSPFLECGTVKMNPHPFVRPGFDAHLPQFEAGVDRLVDVFAAAVAGRRG